MPFGIARTNFRPRPITIGENPQTPLWVAAVVTAGGTVSDARRVLINNVFNSLDGFGLTVLLKRLWLLAAENAGSAAVDLIARSSLSLVGVPTFTANQGYAGNGSSTYLNLNTTVGGSQNSSSYGMASRTNQAALAVNSMGADTGAAGSSNLSIDWSDGNLYFSVNDGDTDAGRTAPASRIGIYIATRTAVTTAVCYKAGASIGTQAITSGSPSARNVFLGATNSSGGATGFTANQFSMALLGSGLTAAQALNLNTVIQTYLTAVGA